MLIFRHLSYKTTKILGHIKMIPTLQKRITKDHQIPLFTTNKVPPPDLHKKMLLKMMEIRIMDNILLEIQRQGRISFYITSTGEEGCQVGSVAALEEGDHIFSQYREVGVLLWRNEDNLKQVIDQCFCNKDDPNKGRQMPIHYQSLKDNFHSISSPLANQMPHAVGAAYILKGKGNIAICYFGEGAASEGDAHAAFNFASTTGSPIIFFCRNNQYAISTPIRDQYKGDGIASRGVGYGMITFRVDGNDAYGVYLVVKMARKIALEEMRPVLIEAITYRIGDHSTSDSSISYREKEEIEEWKKKDPIKRLLLKAKFEWKKEEIEEKLRMKIIQYIKESEKKKKCSISTMFTNVYKDIPWNLREQEQELNDLLKKYSIEFDLDQYSNN